MSGWIAFLFPVLGCLFATGIGLLLLRRWVEPLPVSARWGLCGAVGLGIVGLATFFWGIMGLLSFPLPFVIAWVLLGIYGLASSGHLLRSSSSESLQPVRLFLVFLVVMLLVRLPAVFSPSGDEDWDTLSHQLAMSRIWLEQGKITDIEWMPHSYIPATINMLYLWGLKWGGQYGAKMFSWLLGLLAIFAVGGLTAYRYGRFPGWWAALGLAAVPVFLWEIGTAYQDVSHGLFAGAGAVLAALYLSEKRREWIALSAVCLGFALATKYTGFFVLVAVLLTLIIFSVFEKQASQGIKTALVVLVLSLLLVSPWLVRNEILRGNPVFPFYSHLFGGKNWSAYNAEAWASEQRQFGVGYGVGDFPAAVLGLAVVPDRYANQGSPYYAVGPLLLIGFAYWLFSGRMRREEGALMLILTFSLMVWFVTSQQSRYLASLMIPGLFLVGGAIERSSVKGLIKLAVGLQTAWTLFLFVGLPLPQHESGPPQSAYDHLARHASLINKRLAMQVGAMIGRGGSLGEILTDTFSFWGGTSMINEIHAGLLGATTRQAETSKSRRIKVALFDEPRGYYLHAEYFWANPNYHTLIPYDNIRSPEEFVEALKQLGTTHIYISLLYIDPQERQALMQWIYQPEGAPPLKESFRKWIIEAYGKGLIRRVGVFNTYEGPGEWQGHPQSFLFEIAEGAPPPGWTPPPSE
jgi:4-amino-4-deoxy-L-arabinose transferase-like glycosyltransferase